LETASVPTIVAALGDPGVARAMVGAELYLTALAVLGVAN
jgi:hypothetical protein